MHIHIFGKQGCAKCAVLKKRVESILAEEGHDADTLHYHDCMTAEGLTEFCQVNLNPNNLPAMLIADCDNRYLTCDHASDDDKSATYPYKGVQTDYSTQHNGIITPQRIREIINEAYRP